MSRAQHLADFEAALRQEIGGRMIRPFVCDGSPLDCQVAIIGFNPATQEDDSIWRFWKAGYGFEKALWLEHYKSARRARNGQNGRRVQELSNTRRVLEWITDAAGPARCLETNLYPGATRTAAELPANQRDATLLEFLLKQIQPHLLVVHGKDSAAHVARLYPSEKIVALKDCKPSDIERLRVTFALPGSRTGRRIIKVPHFSRGWSQDAARKLGSILRDGVALNGT